MVLTGRRLQRRVDEARELLEELDAGAIDDARDVLQEIDELLADWPAGDHEVKTRLLEAQRALGTPVRRAAKKTSTKGAARATKPAPSRRSTAASSRTHGLRAQMTFHVRIPTRAMLGEVEAAWSGVLDWLGRDRFHWLQQTHTRMYGPLSAAAWPRLAARFAASGRDGVWIDVKGSDPARGEAGANDVAEVGVRVAAHPRGSNLYATELSVLQVLTPVDEMMEDPRGWRDRFVALCERIPPFAAISGHVIATCELTLRLAERAPFVERLNAIVEQQPGVDLSLHDGRALLRTNSIHWVGWLTALSGAQLRRLGGVERVRAGLSREVELLPLADGVVLQAGPRPATGEGGRLPAAYASVWRAVRAVLAPYRRAPSG